MYSKKVLYGGRGDSNFADGTKLIFHYRTNYANESDRIIDDSRKPWPEGYGAPVEIVLGKQFKIASWEACLRAMKVGEVSSYTMTPQDYGEYPFVSRQLRDLSKRKLYPSETDSMPAQPKCSLGLHFGLGYAELDELLKNPQPLMFTFELLGAELPGSYEPESWQLSPEAKLSSLPDLRERGNEAVKAGNYIEACRLYSEGLDRIEAEIWKHRAEDETYSELDAKKIPFLLNIAQCRLRLEDYYAAIQACDEILARDPNSEKGLWRRAKAHAGAWNFAESRRDWERLMIISPLLKDSIELELKKLSSLEAKKSKDAQKTLSKLFT